MLDNHSHTGKFNRSAKGKISRSIRKQARQAYQSRDLFYRSSTNKQSKVCSLIHLEDQSAIGAIVDSGGVTYNICATKEVVLSADVVPTVP